MFNRLNILKKSETYGSIVVPSNPIDVDVGNDEDARMIRRFYKFLAISQPAIPTNKMGFKRMHRTENL